MRRLLAIAAAVILLPAVSACGGGDEEPALAAFARHFVEVLAEINAAHAVLVDPAVEALPAVERERRYSAVGQEIASTLRRVNSTPAPLEAEGVRRTLGEILVRERDAWVHMVLYARTGQEVHRVQADAIVIDNELETAAAARQLAVLLTEAGLSPGGIGLTVPTPVPTALAPVAATNTPSPIAPTPTPTQPPRLPTASPPPTIAPSATPVITLTPPSAGTGTAERGPTVTPTPSPLPTSVPTAVPTPSPNPTPTNTSIPEPVITEGNLVVNPLP